jgi:probable rRNA maturation factor
MPLRRARGLVVSVVDYRGRRVAGSGLGPWLAGVAPRGAVGEVAVALVGDRRMRALNLTFRGKDYATDVLSFPAEHESRSRSARTPSIVGAAPLGDIVIATGVAARQAARLGHSVRDELRVLALHGLLHLLGYNHELDAGQMARAERRLGTRGGLKASLIGRVAMR